MQVSELFDIEPSHTDVNEVSHRRIDYGDGYAPVGYATLWLWSNLSPQSVTFDRALSVAGAALKAANEEGTSDHD